MSNFYKVTSIYVIMYHFFSFHAKQWLLSWVLLQWMLPVVNDACIIKMCARRVHQVCRLGYLSVTGQSAIRGGEEATEQ